MCLVEGRNREITVSIKRSLVDPPGQQNTLSSPLPRTVLCTMFLAPRTTVAPFVPLLLCAPQLHRRSHGSHCCCPCPLLARRCYCNWCGSRCRHGATTTAASGSAAALLLLHGCLPALHVNHRGERARHKRDKRTGTAMSCKKSECVQAFSCGQSRAPILSGYTGSGMPSHSLFSRSLNQTLANSK